LHRLVERGGCGRDRFQKDVDPSQRLPAVALAAAIKFEFDLMRHKRAVVAHLNPDIANRRDDAGKRGRLGGDQVDAGLLARIPCLVRHLLAKMGSGSARPAIAGAAVAIAAAPPAATDRKCRRVVSTGTAVLFSEST
jgi:hypothetical protein